MLCHTCSDKGIVTVNWADAEPEYAVCLCATGLAMRNDLNCGKSVAPLWRVWCARHQVEPSKVHRIEHVLDADELQARGFTQPSATQPLDAIAAAARAKGRTAKL